MPFGGPVGPILSASETHGAPKGPKMPILGKKKATLDPALSEVLKEPAQWVMFWPTRAPCWARMGLPRDTRNPSGSSNEARAWCLQRREQQAGRHWDKDVNREKRKRRGESKRGNTQDGRDLGKRTEGGRDSIQRRGRRGQRRRREKEEDTAAEERG